MELFSIYTNKRLPPVQNSNPGGARKQHEMHLRERCRQVLCNEVVNVVYHINGKYPQPTLAKTLKKKAKRYIDNNELPLVVKVVGNNVEIRKKKREVRLLPTT